MADGEKAPGFGTRLRAAWQRLRGGGPSPEQEAKLDAYRARAQAEQERLDAHRQTGRFGGTGR